MRRWGRSPTLRLNGNDLDLDDLDVGREDEEALRANFLDPSIAAAYGCYAIPQVVAFSCRLVDSCARQGGDDSVVFYKLIDLR